MTLEPLLTLLFGDCRFTMPAPFPFCDKSMVRAWMWSLFGFVGLTVLLRWRFSRSARRRMRGDDIDWRML